jgi:hypothetical protein
MRMAKGMAPHTDSCFKLRSHFQEDRMLMKTKNRRLLMPTLLMFLALPQNMAVPAKFCYLSSRRMFIGNVGPNKNAGLMLSERE